MTHREETVTINGCAIRLMRGGKGPRLLFLHGASGAGPWAPFMERLAGRFDLIVPEHPGFGGSETPDWFDNIHDLAYFYIEFLRALDLRDVHLVGLSLGGWIAAEVAVRTTSRIASLTLMSSAGIKLRGVEQIDPFLRTDEERIRDFFVDQSLADAMIARVLTPENEDINLKNRHATARVSWQPRGHDPDLHKWLHLIDVPTLILWGDQDRLFPRPYAEAFGELIPGSKVVVFEECGHLPHIEKEDAFIAEVTRFITGVAA